VLVKIIILKIYDSCKIKTRLFFYILKIDKNALEQQVTDKKLMEEMENKRSDAFGMLPHLNNFKSKLYLVF
jgi:hypothetical protein